MKTAKKALLSVLLAGGGWLLPTAAIAACDTKNNANVQLGIPMLIGGKLTDCIPNNSDNGGAIVVYIKAILQYLSGAVGLVVVLMLVIAGIQYITSVGDPTRIKSAKDRITNAIIALALFLFGFAILSFIIPGSLFG